MILSDRDIKRYIADGAIKIDPFPDLDVALGSCSIDFRLGNTFMVFEHSSYSYIDPRQPRSIGEGMRTIEVADDERFIMQAGDFALASTIESLELSDDLVSSPAEVPYRAKAANKYAGQRQPRASALAGEVSRLDIPEKNGAR
jgi:dCTP deaminase